MRIPKSFMIKGKKYSVRIEKHLRHEDGSKVDGLCDLDNRTIYLDKGLKRKEMEKVLLHEVFHAIIFEAHINPGVRFSEGIEEVLCDAFADFHVMSTILKWKNK